MSEGVAGGFGLPRDNPYSLISYLKRYRKQFWIQTAGGVIFNTVIVAGPIILGKAIDAAAHLAVTGPTPTGVRALALACAALVLVTVFFQYARYVKRWYIRDMSNRIACDMRAGFLSRTLFRPLASIERESVGDMMSRTLGDVEQIVTTMQSTINETWDTWLLMISYFAVLLIYDTRITLICSIPIPLAVAAAEAARHPLYRYSLNARRAASVINAHLQKTLNGISILRLFGREEAERNRLGTYSAELARWNIKTAVLQTGMMPIYATLASLGIIGVIGLGGAKVIADTWSVGRFVAYLAMFSAMTHRTWVAARVFNQFHAARAAWDRIKEKLRAIENSPEYSPADRSGVDRPVPASADVRVRDLHFRYPGGERDTLADISFDAATGSLVGVTGPVGAGKSALAAVLTGLYPYGGEIRVGGEELAGLGQERRARLIAYSGQDPFLYSASIAENIAFAPVRVGTEEYARLEVVLWAAALTDDLALFPQGVDTVVGEKGIRISGGQRQRIALARALYADNPVLVLDDPFSALDIGTERRLIGRLLEYRRGKTVFLFSHRLEAFAAADLILLLEAGSLTEIGTHPELMDRGGIYSQIYTAQAWMERERHG